MSIKAFVSLFSVAMALYVAKSGYNSMSSVENQPRATFLQAKPTSPKSDGVWLQWKSMHSKTYSNAAEEDFRKEIFNKKLAEIEAHNSKKDVSYKLGLNHFSDLQDDEHAKYLGEWGASRPSAATEFYTGSSGLLMATKDGADEQIYYGGVNWADNQQIVNEVQNQGQCGSCWAFATAAALESNIAKKRYRAPEEWKLAAVKGNSMKFNIQEANGTNCIKFDENTLSKAECSGSGTEWVLSTVDEKGQQNGVAFKVHAGISYVLTSNDNGVEYLKFTDDMTKVELTSDIAKATVFEGRANTSEVFEMWEQSTRRVLLVTDGKLVLHENLLKLSEQQLVSCDTDYNKGCGGGDRDRALEYAKRWGLLSSKDYQERAKVEHQASGHFLEKTYESGVLIDEEERNYRCALYTQPENDDQKAAWNKHEFHKTSNVGWVHVEPTNPFAMSDALHRFGPLSIGIYASPPAIRDYKSGVVTGEPCDEKVTNTNHAVVLVGEGTDPKFGPYWIVRNSWSATWGDNGYIKIAKSNYGSKGICLIQSSVYIPDLSPEK